MSNERGGSFAAGCLAGLLASMVIYIAIGAIAILVVAR